MYISPKYKDLLEKLFERHGSIRITSMLGVDAVVFMLPDGCLMSGIGAGETLCLKVDDINRPDWEKQGKRPFVFETENGQSNLKSYYELPEALYDEPKDCRSKVGGCSKTIRRKPNLWSGQL